MFVRELSSISNQIIVKSKICHGDEALRSRSDEALRSRSDEALRNRSDEAMRSLCR